MIFEYKDTPIFYTDQGKGDVVVLLHGFLETSSMWLDIVPELTQKHRVITVDLLGHGQTGCLGYVHTMEMMAEAVAFVLQKLAIKSARFIGHSMGGYVVLALAEAFPDVIHSICLMNSTPFADTVERQLNRDRAINAVKYHRQNFIGMAIGNLFNPENRLKFQNEIEAITLAALRLPVQGIIAALEGMKIRKDRQDILKNSQVETLFILGENDPVLDSIYLKPKLKALNVRTSTLSGGHMLYIENTSELIYKLRQFIEK